MSVASTKKLENTMTMPAPVKPVEILSAKLTFTTPFLANLPPGYALRLRNA
jgi:hypothetical protein